MVYAATSPARGGEVIRLIDGRIARPAGPRPRSRGGAKWRKEHLKGSLMLSLESTSSRMSNLARQEIYFGRQLTLAETLRGIDNVTPESTHELAARIFCSAAGGAGRRVGRLGRLRIRPEELRL